MRVILTLVLLSIAVQGLATAIRSQVRLLVGKKLTSSLAIVAKINEVDEDGRNALHHAVMLGDLPLVEFFLANGANTRATDNNGLIPLRYAERIATEQPSVSRMQIVSLVLEKTRGINRGDERGWTAMVWSLMAGDYPRVIELRDRGADIFAGRFAYPRKGQLAGRHNAVWAAEHLQDDRAIKILAENAPDEYFPVAVGNRYLKFTQQMIKQGIDVNTKDRLGYRAATRAAKAGRLDDLQMLIENGAEIDGEVLFFAVYSGNPKLVATILEHTGKLTPGFTNDEMIEKTNNVFKSDEMIKKTNIDDALVYFSRNHLISPSQERIAQFDKEIEAKLELLIDYGADVNATNNGETPLYNAIKLLKVQRVKLLLERGAVAGDINRALTEASYVVSRNRKYQRDLLAIKRLLADKGLR